jgi:biotin carboxyl carrier protein
MPLSDDDVREILRLIDESDAEELSVETDGFSLYVRRGADAGDAPVSAEADTPVAAPTRSDGAAAGELHTVPSPMLGTFYRAQSPGAAPFVDVGTRVEPDTIVCLIEVMKMMNSVPAGVVGTIAGSPYVAAGLAATGTSSRTVVIKVPLGLDDPTTHIPPANPPTVAKWELGKRLFFDTTLVSVRTKKGCVGCHHGYSYRRDTGDGQLSDLRHQCLCAFLILGQHASCIAGRSTRK